MGNVTILRRGQLLDTNLNRSPSPALAPVTTRSVEPPSADVYAGSGFSQSPSPRSLPLPSFFRRKASDAVDNSATEGLRRLLRLD